MAVTTPKTTILVPDLPRTPVVVDKTGQFTPEWKIFFDQLIQTLQNTLSPEGITMPQQTATNITQLKAAVSLGKILYDSTNNVFVGNVLVGSNYTWKTFTQT